MISAVGRRPKLTMPILAHINFLHKNDTNLFCILKSKWPVGRHPHLSKTALIVGPLIQELANFFIKQTPF